jgi:hypothetical protein
VSHVTAIELSINDLDALAKSGKQLGMELLQKDNFKWYGVHVGDFPLPTGFTKADMGKCEYVLRIKGNSKAYEVGVVKRRDGKPGYTLLWDFWMGGHGLEDAIGKDGSKLKQEYALQTATKELLRKGFKIERKVNAKTGKPQMRAWRTV